MDNGHFDMKCDISSDVIIIVVTLKKLKCLRLPI